MTDVKPDIISKVPSNKEIHFLENKLYEFNADKIDSNDGELFSKLIYDSGNKIIAGILGWTWSNACEITLLWVKYEHRNKGYGNILSQAAESEAKSKNCKTIILQTYSFQSPGFYQKYGYTVEFETKDFPHGYSRFCLIKRLTE